MPNFQQTAFRRVFTPTWQRPFGPYPSWEVNFLGGSANDLAAEGITFTRASSAQDFNDPALTFGTNVPVLTPSGLLLQGARTNLLLNSATLSTQNITTTAAAHTLSFYGTGSVTLSGTATGTLNGTGASNRVTLTFTPTAGTLTLTVTGTVTLAQCELGTFASSYIPTTGTTATRANDIASILNLASLGYNTAQGTLMAEFSTIGQPTAGVVFALTDNTISNLISLRRGAGTPANMLYDVQNGGVAQVNDTFTAVNALQTYRAAVAWQDNNFASVLTGFSLVNDTSGTVPTTVDRLLLGRRNSGGAVDFGFLYLRRLSYFPTRLPDAQLTAIVA